MTGIEAKIKLLGPTHPLCSIQFIFPLFTMSSVNAEERESLRHGAVTFLAFT